MKIVRLNENDIERLVKKIIREDKQKSIQESYELDKIISEKRKSPRRK